LSDNFAGPLFGIFKKSNLYTNRKWLAFEWPPNHGNLMDYYFVLLILISSRKKSLLSEEGGPREKGAGRMCSAEKHKPRHSHWLLCRPKWIKWKWKCECEWISHVLSAKLSATQPASEKEYQTVWLHRFKNNKLSTAAHWMFVYLFKFRISTTLK